MIKNKKIVATIQARMSSSRLPGKALLPLAGEPVLVRMIERLRRSKILDEIIVATTINPADDALVAICKKIGCRFYRGSEDDVLLRILEAAQSCQADIIVQSMADSPLVDWRHVDHLAHMLVEGNYDYATNELKETFPIGFDMRMYPVRILEEVEKCAHDPEYREHASLYIYTHPKKYRLVNWEAEGDLYWPSLRLTLDTKEDYALIKAIYEHLHPLKHDFSAKDVVQFLKLHPELVGINSAVKQRIPEIVQKNNE